MNDTEKKLEELERKLEEYDSYIRDMKLNEDFVGYDYREYDAICRERDEIQEEIERLES